MTLGVESSSCVSPGDTEDILLGAQRSFQTGP